MVPWVKLREDNMFSDANGKKRDSKRLIDSLDVQLDVGFRWSEGGKG